MLITIEVKAVAVLVKGAIMVKAIIKDVTKVTMKAKENTSVII